MHTQNYVLVASGLVFEAQIALKVEGTKVCCGQAPGIADVLAAALAPGCCGILSFGVVGGLDPSLRAGSIVVATDVIGSDRRFPTDTRWSQTLSRLFPDAVQTAIYSGGELHIDPDTKQRSFRAHGAAAVDMESHIAARLAAARGLPFAALRVVADPAHRVLPQSAIAGVRLDGSTSPLAVMRGLVRRPRETFDLAALACDAWVARAALAKAQRQLGRGFSAPGFLELDAEPAAEANLQLNPV